MNDDMMDPRKKAAIDRRQRAEAFADDLLCEEKFPDLIRDLLTPAAPARPAKGPSLLAKLKGVFRSNRE